MDKVGLLFDLLLEVSSLWKVDEEYVDGIYEQDDFGLGGDGDCPIDCWVLRIGIGVMLLRKGDSNAFDWVILRLILLCDSYLERSS